MFVSQDIQMSLLCFLFIARWGELRELIRLNFDIPIRIPARYQRTEGALPVHHFSNLDSEMD
jgi:hypothetical protein